MADETQTPPVATTDANGSGNAGTPPTTEQERRFSQAEIDALIDQRLKREREAAAAKATKERETAEATRKKELGEWESLAKTNEARVHELEASQAQRDSQVEAYDKALTRRIKAEITAWPQEAKDALPKDASALDLAEAVERIRPLAEKLSGAPARPVGNVAGPRPAGDSREDQQGRERNALRARGFGARM